MKELNLCEILKGHEGKVFYSPIFGNIILKNIDDKEKYSIRCIRPKYEVIVCFTKQGHYTSEGEECLIFPSKDQRDWDKWVEENNAPKTWSEYVFQFRIDTEPTLEFDDHRNWGVIGKSCSALFKINRLIEVGYGGNITNEEWNSTEAKYFIYCVKNEFHISGASVIKHFIAFHTIGQAEKFLSYPENIQLLLDYFMI